jgi:hypothetical protein
MTANTLVLRPELESVPRPTGLGCLILNAFSVRVGVLTLILEPRAPSPVGCLGALTLILTSTTRD